MYKTRLEQLESNLSESNRIANQNAEITASAISSLKSEMQSEIATANANFDKLSNSLGVVKDQVNSLSYDV
jgi:predicted  nucleic acid-binding Zn-ribbon protein